MNYKKKKQNSPIKTWLKRIIISNRYNWIVGLVGGAGLFAYYASKAPELDEELLKDPISSEFYDVNGELFATIGVEKTENILNMKIFHKK